MIALWIIGGIVLFLIILAFLKVGVCICYREQKVAIRFQVGFLKFSLKEKGEQCDNKVKRGGENKAKGKKSRKTYTPWIKVVVKNWTYLLSLVGKILSAPTIDKLEAVIKVGDDEPDECALKYGRVCALVGTLLAPVENTFEIKRRKVDVLCCFDQTELYVEASVSATLRVYQALSLAIEVIKFVSKVSNEVKIDKKVVESV